MSAILESANLISEEDYLRGELVAETKHEYVGGRVYAMVGVSDRHGLLVINLASALHGHLRGGPCQVFASDMKLKLKLAEETVYYYPDILVSCHPQDRARYWREQPVVLVEVLSEATERIDRREKYLAYKTIASLQEYVLVAQDVMQLTVFRRNAAWQPLLLGPQDTLRLESIDFSLPLSELYEGVPL